MREGAVEGEEPQDGLAAQDERSSAWRKGPSAAKKNMVRKAVKAVCARPASRVLSLSACSKSRTGLFLCQGCSLLAVGSES